MSYSFDGTIREFCGIRVDKFNKPAKLYLLTHCHSDHCVGLESKSFSTKVYCSHTTKQLLSSNSKYSHTSPFLIPVDFNSPISLVVNGCYITVTLIPSYHCPGSTMFLIEGSDQSVLVTGDIRAEKWWIQSLRKLPFLFPYTCFKRLLNIYFDSTFLYRGEPFVEIPPNNDGFESVLELVKLYPDDDSDIQFNFVDDILGFEECWSSIVGACNGRLKVNETLRDRFRVLEDSKTYLYGISGFTLNKLLSSTSGHSFNVKAKPDCKFPVTIRQCINFNIVDLAGVFFPIDLHTLTEDDKANLVLLDTLANGHKVYQFKDRRWLLPKNCNTLLSNEIKLVYSRHSSYTETRELISLFKPMQVFPCSETKTTWLNGSSMRRLFGDVCTGSDFSYDNMMFSNFGNPNVTRPPTTINRWNPDVCHQEWDFVNYVINGITFPFKGQYHNNGFLNPRPNAEEFNNTWRNDMRLQNIIAGRGEAKYKKTIEKYQKLYHDRIRRNLATDIQIPMDDSTTVSSLESTSQSARSECLLSLSKFLPHCRPLSAPLKMELVSQAGTTSDRETDRIHVAKRPRPSLKRNQSREINPTQVETRNGLSTTNSIQSSIEIIAERRVSPAEKSFKIKISIDEGRIEEICARLARHPSDWYKIRLESTGN